MTTHKTGTRAEWLTARLELLEAEKALTRRSDELARRCTMWTGPAVGGTDCQGDATQGISVFLKNTSEEANGENDDRRYERREQ